MKDERKTKEQLIAELTELRQRVAELETAEAERVRAEEALREGEERYRSVYNTAPLAFVIWDRDCRVTDWNQYAERLFGWSREEILGHNFFEFLIPESARPQVEVVVDALLRGELPSHSVNENLTQSGEIILCEWNNSIRYDNEGRVVGAMSLALDITERVRAEEEIRQLSQFQESVIDNANVWLNVLDAEANVVIWNKAAEEISGYSREEVVGHGKIWEWLYPDEAYRDQVLARAMAIIEKGGGEEDAETIIRRKDGETRIMAWNSHNLVDEAGNPIGSIALGRDVTERVRAEEALRESEERYRTLFEAIPVGLYRTMPDGQFLDANQAMAHMLGYPDRESLLTISAADLYVDPKDRRQWQALLETEGVARNYEVQLLRRDGTIIWGQESTQVIRDNEGRTLYYDGTIEDITERVRVEEKLRRNLQEMTLLNQVTTLMASAADTSDALYHVCAELARFLQVPQAAFALFNPQCTAAEVIADHHPPDSPSAIGVVLPVADNPSMAYILEHKAPLAVTDAQTDPLLTPVHEVMRQRNVQSILIVPIVVEREVIGTLGLDAFQRRVFGDSDVDLIQNVANQTGQVLMRKRAEEERELLLAQIRERAQQMLQIMNTVPEGVLLLDADLRLLVTNPVGQQHLQVLTDSQWRESLRQDAEPVLTHLGGRPIAELLASPPPGLWHEVVANGQSFEVIAQPIETGPDPGGWTLVIRDVTTERGIREQAETQARLAAVGQLAAGIAHDFSNLLTSIIGFSELLKFRSQLPEDAQERVDLVVRQGYRAADLVGQILDFSRQSPSRQQPVDLVPLLKEMMKLLRQTVPETIEMALEIETGESWVNADLTQIQQVLTNLTINARDAMPKGGKLRVNLSHQVLKPEEPTLFPDMKPGKWVVLKVSDTGAGIPPDVLPRIFEPFFTTKTPGEGTGLGLAQVHGIVGQHAGFIDVQTESGQGTTFIVYLPALRGAREAARETMPETIANGQGGTILVAEDDPAVLATIQRMLEQLKYQVLTARDGQEALQVYDQYHDQIAMVLTDMVMPRMGGLELFHTLRAQNPDVKVVVMTGYVQEEEAEKLLAQGVVEWVQKPVSFTQLAQVVSQALQ